MPYCHWPKDYALECFHSGLINDPPEADKVGPFSFRLTPLWL